MEDYDVYNADSGEYMGSIEMKEDATTDDMPNCLEINGVYYKTEK